jgi:multidrug efflux pump subunit AcrA (membrane-fusion protein)
MALTACHAQPPAAPPASPALVRPVIALPAGNGPVRIPAAAIVDLGGIPGVYVLNADHVARFRMVRAGKDAGGRVEVLSGLTGGETLVGGDVHDGSPIQTR